MFRRELIDAKEAIEEAVGWLVDFNKASDEEDCEQSLEMAKSSIHDAETSADLVGGNAGKEVAGFLKKLHERFGQYSASEIINKLDRIGEVISSMINLDYGSKEEDLEVKSIGVDFESSDESDSPSGSEDEDAEDEMEASDDESSAASEASEQKSSYPSFESVSDDEEESGRLTSENNIWAKDFRKKIEKYLNLTDDKAVQDEQKEINQYLAAPERIQGAARFGGVSGIWKAYAPRVLKKTFLFSTDAKLANKNKYQEITGSEWQTVSTGMTLLAQRFKLEKAYRRLLAGKKFEIAGLTKGEEKKLSQQERNLGLEKILNIQERKGSELNKSPSLYSVRRINPIAVQSRKNKEKLIGELKNTTELTNENGLRLDELRLFEVIVKLPFRLQHATNYFYPIVNSGKFSSYTEIKRSNPNYKSKFSTDGNIDILGNDGFVFFRCYIGPINNAKTRYGDTSLIFDLNLLSQSGWVSLHDQLNPFPDNRKNRKNNPREQGPDYATEKVVYRDNSLLRMAKAIGIHATSKSDKRKLDGMSYQYKAADFSYKNKKETQKNFKHKEFKQSFLDEVFFGPDIFPGIALSVIRELRRLESCGFRKQFMAKFDQADDNNKLILLGKLIKDLFRIEGKYPVGLGIKQQKSPAEKKLSAGKFRFSHAASNWFHPFQVINPSGNGCFNPDLSANQQALGLAEQKEKQFQLEGSISNLRRQKAKAANQMVKDQKNIATKEEEVKKLTLEGKTDASGEKLKTQKKLQDEKNSLQEKINRSKEKISSLDSRINGNDLELKNLKLELGKNEEARAKLYQYFTEKKVTKTVLDKIDTPKLQYIHEHFEEFFLPGINSQEIELEQLFFCSHKQLERFVATAASSTAAKQIESLSLSNDSKESKKADIFNHDIYSLTSGKSSANKAVAMEVDVKDESKKTSKAAANLSLTAVGLFSHQQQGSPNRKQSENKDILGRELLDAAEEKNLAKVKSILEKHKDLLNYQDEGGYAAIHHAVENSDEPMVDFLLGQIGIRLDLEVKESTDALGDALPLHIAVCTGDLSIVKKLVEADSKVINRHDYNGYTPSHEAIIEEQLDVFKLLVQLGADINAHTREDKSLTGIPEGLNCLRLAKYLKKDEMIPAEKAQQFIDFITSEQDRLDSLENYPKALIETSRLRR